MSEQESLRIQLYENIQKIQLFHLNNNYYSKITIDRLKRENIKLKDKLDKLKKV